MDLTRCKLSMEPFARRFCCDNARAGLPTEVADLAHICHKFTCCPYMFCRDRDLLRSRYAPLPSLAVACQSSRTFVWIAVACLCTPSEDAVHCVRIPETQAWLGVDRIFSGTSAQDGLICYKLPDLLFECMLAGLCHILQTSQSGTHF